MQLKNEALVITTKDKLMLVREALEVVSQRLQVELETKQRRELEIIKDDLDKEFKKTLNKIEEDKNKMQKDIDAITLKMRNLEEVKKSYSDLKKGISCYFF